MADQFKRVMVAAYNEKLAAAGVSMFLLRFFGKNPEEISISETEKIDIDVIRDVRLLSADVVRGSGAGYQNVVGKYLNHEYAVPLYWEEGPITATMLNKRLPGIDPYTPSGRMEALSFFAAQVQVDNTNKIVRAMEKQAAEALQTGLITLSNGESLDFGKKAGHAITPSTKWDNSGDPIGDLETLADVLHQNGKMRPDTLIFGKAAWNVFINNANVRTYLDNRRIEPGNFAPGDIVDGAKLWGRFDVGQYTFDAYIYDEFYQTDSTTFVSYITTDTVVMMNRAARLVKAFAAVEVLPQFEADYRQMGMPQLPQFEAGQFVPFVYEKAPSALMAGVQSAPLVVPTAIDTVGTLINVDT